MAIDGTTWRPLSADEQRRITCQYQGCTEHAQECQQERYSANSATVTAYHYACAEHAAKVRSTGVWHD